MKNNDDNLIAQQDSLKFVLRPWNGCAQNVADGLQRVLDEISTPLPPPSKLRARHRCYSLTSRKSIWVQFRRHLDKPLAEVIDDYQWPWQKELLEGFQLATAGRKLPKWHIDKVAWMAANNAEEPIIWSSLLVRGAPPTPGDEQENVSVADQILDCLSAWDENIRFAIHSIWKPWFCHESWGNAYHQFCATLDTIRELLDALRFFRPQTGCDPFRAHDGARPRLPDDRTRRQGGGYCELCWRPTMRTVAISSRTMLFSNKVPGMKARQLSNRFCSAHDPTDPKSRYRADHRYKEVFQREFAILRGLAGKAARSTFTLQLQARSTDDEDLRKAAYDLVHARLRSLSNLKEPGFREEVWLRYQKGMRQADIARELGTTRQSVCRALQSIKKLLDRQRQDKLQNPRLYERPDLSDQMRLIACYHYDGVTPAEIAQVLDQPEGIVKASIDWLLATS